MVQRPDFDLELVPSDALAEELLRRVEHGIIAVMHTRLGTAADETRIERHWKGNAHVCMGLAHDVASVIFANRRMEELQGADDEAGC